MADQGRTPDEPGRIEVGLSFLSAQDSAAFREMKEAFAQAGKMFEAMKATDFVAQSQKMVELTQMMNTENDRRRQAEDRDRQMQQRGSGILGRVQGAIEGWRAPTAEETTERLRQQQENQDRIAERANATVNTEATGENVDEDRLTARQREANVLRVRNNLPPIQPDEETALEPTTSRMQRLLYPGGQRPVNWYDRLDDLTGEHGGRETQIPQYGQMTLQDYFNLFRDRSQKKALAAQRDGNKEEAKRHGEQAARMEDLANASLYGYAGMQLFRRVRSAQENFGSVTGFQPLEFGEQGAALGFRRDTNWASTIAGAQTPFSAAGRQGERQWRDTLSMRFNAGINGEQAQAITNAVAQAGFSGEQGTNIGDRFMRPMFQQFGVNPESLIPFTQVLRTGTGTIDDLTNSLSDLGELARSAQTDVNTMAHSLAQAGEAAQAAGGYFQSGVQFGRQFTQGTGLQPEVGQQLLQDPLSQAMLSGMTGLPTQALAAAPAGAKVEAGRNMLMMRYQAYRSRLGTEGAERPVMIGRERVGTVRGDNPAMAAAAADAGINADQAERILRGTDFQSAVTTLDDALTARQQEYENKGGMSTEEFAQKAKQWAKGRGERFNERTGQFEYKQADETTGKITWRKDASGEIARQFSDKIGAPALADMAKDPSGVDRDDIVRAAHRAGIRGKELGEALDKKTPDAQAKAVRQLISERAAEEQAKYQIAFTGPAKKLFKALVNQAGGNFDRDYNEPANSAAASSRGPNPLGDGTNTGIFPEDFNNTGPQ